AKDSMKEISVGKHKLAGTTDENNENGLFVKNEKDSTGGLGEKGNDNDGSGTGKGEEGNGNGTNDPSNNNDTPEKPEFGNGDKEDDSDKTLASAKNTNTPNTGDTSSILLYAFLLIASLIPLGVKMKRRVV